MAKLTRRNVLLTGGLAAASVALTARAGAEAPAQTGTSTPTPTATPSGGCPFSPVDYVSNMVQGFQQGTGVPGVAVALRANGVDSFINFGVYDTTKPNATVTQDVVFEIGSNTKTFTATLLAAQTLGPNAPKALSDPPTKYLPASLANSNLRNVTLQMLATHTSGLPDSGGGAPGDQLFSSQPPSSEFITFLNNWKPDCPPGTNWLYSDDAFVVLGFAVAYQPGNPTPTYPYNQLLAQTITTPLNMRSTYAGFSPPPGLTIATGYVDQGGGNFKPTTKVASDIKSTARDLLSWLKAQLGMLPAGASSQLAQAILATHYEYFNGLNNLTCPGQGQPQQPDPLPFDMGLAWQIYDRIPGVQTFLAKNGGVTGFTSYMAFSPSSDPNRQVALAILTNGSNLTPIGSNHPNATSNVTNLGQTIMRRLAATTAS